LGNIGGAMAANLVADGHGVTVFDLDPGRVAAVGGTAAASVADVARAAGVTFTSLPDPETVSKVADEWAAAAPAGAVLCDLSTTLPGSNRAIAARLAATASSRPRSPAVTSAR
jgi:3-hydroxyisobutyrate dehydrogenase